MVTLRSFLRNIHERTFLFKALFNCMNQYENLLLHSETDTNNLEYMAQYRQPVWDFLVQHCESFAHRDCDAIFSEIFSSQVFNAIHQNTRGIEKV